MNLEIFVSTRKKGTSEVNDLQNELLKLRALKKEQGEQNQILEKKLDNVNDRLQAQDKIKSKDCLTFQNPPFDACRPRNATRNTLKFFRKCMNKNIAR